jgi:hypothetical protein
MCRLSPARQGNSKRPLRRKKKAYWHAGSILDFEARALGQMAWIQSSREPCEFSFQGVKYDVDWFSKLGLLKRGGSRWRPRFGGSHDRETFSLPNSNRPFLVDELNT